MIPPVRRNSQEFVREDLPELGDVFQTPTTCQKAGAFALKLTPVLCALGASLTRDNPIESFSFAAVGGMTTELGLIRPFLKDRDIAIQEYYNSLITRLLSTMYLGWTFGSQHTDSEAVHEALFIASVWLFSMAAVAMIRANKDAEENRDRSGLKVELLKEIPKEERGLNINQQDLIEPMPLYCSSKIAKITLPLLQVGIGISGATLGYYYMEEGNTKRIITTGGTVLATYPAGKYLMSKLYKWNEPYVTEGRACLLKISNFFCTYGKGVFSLGIAALTFYPSPYSNAAIGLLWGGRDGIYEEDYKRCPREDHSFSKIPFYPSEKNRVFITKVAIETFEILGLVAKTALVMGDSEARDEDRYEFGPFLPSYLLTYGAILYTGVKFNPKNATTFKSHCFYSLVYNVSWLQWAPFVILSGQLHGEDRDDDDETTAFNVIDVPMLFYATFGILVASEEAGADSGVLGPKVRDIPTGIMMFYLWASAQRLGWNDF